ncbi:MAG TPA: hypothetical protein VMM13_16040 [Euzebya sp.]|nr:hypothetical protein [Euzebya sp.]
MTPPAIITDPHGDRYAPVWVEELADWAWLLGRIEDWLLHAHDDTIVDWAQFCGPHGEGIEEVTDTLGRWSVRMRDLAQGRP